MLALITDLAQPSRLHYVPRASGLPGSREGCHTQCMRDACATKWSPITHFPATIGAVIRYRNNRLIVEEVPVQRIAETVGTPVYIYSRRKLLSNYDAYRRAFRGISHLICYALKANSNLSLLKLLARNGSGADIVSGGELYRAMKAGFAPERIVFSGVGKTIEELEAAIRKKILSIHIESEQEMVLVNDIAATNGMTVSVSLRLNPNINPRTHPYISTGLRKHKFGIPIQMGPALFLKAASLAHIRIDGLHVHLGSQIPDVKPFEEAVLKLLDMVDELKRTGITLSHLDIGGGLAVSEAENEADPKKLGSILRPLLKERKLRLIVEPGRSIVADAGILLAKVLYTKSSFRKRFVIVDAGMNDFIRPSLYGAFHEIVPVTVSDRPSVIQDVVGPVCESADFFAQSRPLQECAAGEFLAITQAGAYGFSMSSNYNSRRRPAEVLVSRDKFYIIRRRESFPDLTRGEL